MDYEVMHLFQTKDTYKRYHKYIKDHLIQPETKIVLDSMGEIYSGTPAATISCSMLDTWIMSRHGTRLSPSTILVIKDIIRKLEKYVPEDGIEIVFKSLIEQDYVAQIMQEADKVRTGSSDLEHVHSLATSALRDLERFIDRDELFVIPDIRSVVERIKGTGYEWRLMALNKSLGLLRTGDFVIIAARVEVGKTTFLASEASYIAGQLPKDRPIVWVNNEEKSDTVFFRVVQAACGATTEEITVDPDKYMKMYEDLMGGDRKKILITDGNTNHVNALTTLFQDINPGMIIFDQLDKVGGFPKEDREDLRLGKLYKWARELAREYGPVIAASQLTAEITDLKDPPYIGLEHLRGSKTDKPGEADVVITIGKYKHPANAEEELLRSINIPKNKLPGGGKYFSEADRHGKFLVRIDPLRARYE